MKPLIGITPSPMRDEQPHGTFDRAALATTYVNAILAAGGIPLIVPPQDDNAGAMLDAIDGLLLSGGADVEPARYGDREVHPTTYGVHPLRDRFECALIEGALRRDMPLLGICRGIQILNVALGGTLIQDIADQRPSAIHHRQHEVGLRPDDVGHQATIQPDSLLDRVYGTARLGVNSFHHQAVKDVAPRLIAAAHAPDGTIEGVVVADTSFALAVQWHPEMMFERHPEQLKPFAALVEAALARKLAGSLA